MADNKEIAQFGGADQFIPMLRERKLADLIERLGKGQYKTPNAFLNAIEGAGLTDMLVKEMNTDGNQTLTEKEVRQFFVKNLGVDPEGWDKNQDGIVASWFQNPNTGARQAGEVKAGITAALKKMGLKETVSEAGVVGIPVSDIHDKMVESAQELYNTMKKQGVVGEAGEIAKEAPAAPLGRNNAKSSKTTQIS